MMSSSIFSSLILSHPPALHPLYPKPSSSSSSSLNPSSTSLYTPKKPLQFSCHPKTLNLNLNRSPNPRRRFTPLAINLTVGNPEGPSKRLEINAALDRACNLFDKLPEPVKDFPWTKTLESFLRTVLGLALAVFKYLSIPILAVSQLSEMSYCAHERKMVLIPVPFLVGFAVAGVMKDTAVELSPDLKEGVFPWHLALTAILFALLKLPGPYYPYWGRLLIPHFANGGLWRIVWSALMWYIQTRSASLDDSN